MKIVTTEKGLEFRSQLRREINLQKSSRYVDPFPVPIDPVLRSSTFISSLNFPYDKSLIENDVQISYVGKGVDTPFRIPRSSSNYIKIKAMIPKSEIIALNFKSDVDSVTAKSSKDLKLLRLHNKRKNEQDSLKLKLKHKISCEFPIKKTLQDVTEMLERCKSERENLQTIKVPNKIKNMARFSLKNYKKS